MLMLSSLCTSKHITVSEFCINVLMILCSVCEASNRFITALPPLFPPVLPPLLPPLLASFTFVHLLNFYPFVLKKSSVDLTPTLLFPESRFFLILLLLLLLHDVDNERSLTGFHSCYQSIAILHTGCVLHLYKAYNLLLCNRHDLKFTPLYVLIEWRSKQSPQAYIIS